nr:hypothetical protein GCM10025730_38260 [Promicromonospora thailandica]
MSTRPTLLSSGLLPSRLLGTPMPSRSAGPAGPSYRLGDPGRPAAVPTLLIALFDNSGSVMGPRGTDALSNRYAEVEHAFSVVAHRGSPRELGAIIHFDTPSSGEVAPTPLTRQGLVGLRVGLHPPADGAGTSDLGPSLTRARALTERHPEHEATLVVLSDFFLTDSDPGAVLSDLAAFPGTVHAVVLGGRPPRAS